MDKCVYVKQIGRRFVFLVLYVDDILLVSNEALFLQDIKNFLSKQFDMKDIGEATYILGIQIDRDRSRRFLGLSQKTYIDKVLKRYDMAYCKPGEAPVIKGDVFRKS